MTDIEVVKQKTDIIDLISETVVLKKTGANFKGNCPFHNEKTPSFVVSPERQIWHCFGGCQDGGDIFRFIMRLENIEFPESLKILAKRAGVTLSNVRDSKTSDLKDKLYEINKLACDFYHYLLTTHPLGVRAREYLSKRQITNNSITLFSLGYSPESWDSLIKFMAKKKISLEDLFLAGLVSKSQSGKYFDRFRGRLMFTLKDQHGNILGFAGRSLNPEVKEAKYINTAETPVYIKGNVLYGLDICKDEIKREGFAVVVEGEIDLIQSYQAGVRNIVAIKGSAFTENQVQLLKRYTKNISLALDGDFAGDSAAHRGISIADTAGMDIRVITFSEAKDPDELIKLNPTLWHQAVKNSVPFYDFIITSAINKFETKSAQGAKNIVAETAKFLHPIDNLVVKDHYLKSLAKILDLPVETLELQMEKEYKKMQFTSNHQLSTQPVIENVKNKSRLETLAQYLLALVLQSQNPKEYFSLLFENLEIEDFPKGILRNIFLQIVNFIKSNNNFSVKEFASTLPPENINTFDELCLMDLPINMEKNEIVLKEVDKVVKDLQEQSLRSRLKSLTLDLQTATENQKREMEIEFQKISEKMSGGSSQKVA